MVSVQSLCKSVPDAGQSLQILNNVSFQLEQGRSLAIVGASGSGKSTLLGLMAGLDTPSQGKVVLAGQSLFDMNEEGRAAFRAAHVGFVFQSFQLLDHLTALENVSLPLELARVRNVRSLASDMLFKVGLGDRLNHFPRTLSGGEQQRVALARAFVAKPALIFADEPTGSLDAQTGERIISLMFDLQKNSGSTLILVTHDEALAARCDTVFHLQAPSSVAASPAAVSRVV
jgi:putative ABC transport system ATP-binding protein